MIPLHQMKIIQIDVTNACPNRCSNCTRFSGHHAKPFFMDLEFYKNAVDSLADFPGMVGMIGGEPLLHPRFEEMLDYLAARIPEKKRRGLWSTLPEALAPRHALRIKDVFGHLFCNDHSIRDILHQPILVGAAELVPDKQRMWELIDNCWVQTMWSATITPKGAFFCEVAGAFDMLYHGPGGWPVEPGWWQREPHEFTEQKGRWCAGCGCAIPLPRRSSAESLDDIGPTHLAALRHIGSPKIRKGLYELYDAARHAAELQAQGQDARQAWDPNPNWYMSDVADERAYRQRVIAKLDADNTITNANTAVAFAGCATRVE